MITSGMQDRAKTTQREIEQQQMTREATLEQFRRNTQIRVANAAAAKREAVMLRNAALVWQEDVFASFSNNAYWCRQKRI